MTGFSEAQWENLALDLLAEPLGWQPKTGEQIAPGSGERDSWDELLIRPRLLEALRRLNPMVPGEYLQQALAEIASPKSQDAITDSLPEELASNLPSIETLEAELSRQDTTCKPTTEGTPS